MIDTMRVIGLELRNGWKPILLYGFLFAMVFQLVMLLALVVRFQALPNYIQFYNWFGNIIHIFQSTPSWIDIAGIAREEWLLEIGQMNYDFGTGLSIWSLNVIPSRVLMLTIMGAMVALCMRLRAYQQCAVHTQRSAMAALSGGSLLVAMTNVTMSWVVCCATPSWVVGLAMLGLGVSTSLALESMGPILSSGGFVVLTAACLALAWRTSQLTPPMSNTTELEHA